MHNCATANERSGSSYETPPNVELSCTHLAGLASACACRTAWCLPLMASTPCHADLRASMIAGEPRAGFSGLRVKTSRRPETSELVEALPSRQSEWRAEGSVGLHARARSLQVQPRVLGSACPWRKAASRRKRMFPEQVREDHCAMNLRLSPGSPSAPRFRPPARDEIARGRSR
jgi:hypothetical protein